MIEVLGIGQTTSFAEGVSADMTQFIIGFGQNDLSC
jgi:hypothetical protein